MNCLGDVLSNVPSVTIAADLPLKVYLSTSWGSFLISSQIVATPGV